MRVPQLCFCLHTHYQAIDPKLNFQPEAECCVLIYRSLGFRMLRRTCTRIMPFFCRLFSASLKQLSTSAQTSQIVIMDFIHSLCGLYCVTCFNVRGPHVFNRLSYFLHMRSDCCSVHTGTVNRSPLAGCKLVGLLNAW